MILAVTETTSTVTSTAPEHFSLLHLPTHWPAQGDLIDWCQHMSPGTAALLVLAGMVYLMFGIYAFKGLVALNAALAGGCLGAIIGDRIADVALIGAIVGAVLAAATTLPMMKYAIAFMGAVLGAIIGAALWRYKLDANLAWAGAIVGFISFGMLSFSLFKPSVMLYTSVQGAAMLMFGVLGLTFKYQSVTPQLVQHMQVKPFLLPLAIFISAALGIIYQQHNYGQPESAGASGGGAKKKK